MSGPLSGRLFDPHSIRVQGSCQPVSDVAPAAVPPTFPYFTGVSLSLREVSRVNPAELDPAHTAACLAHLQMGGTGGGRGTEAAGSPVEPSDRRHPHLLEQS